MQRPVGLPGSASRRYPGNGQVNRCLGLDCGNSVMFVHKVEERRWEGISLLYNVASEPRHARYFFLLGLHTKCDWHVTISNTTAFDRSRGTMWVVRTGRCGGEEEVERFARHKACILPLQLLAPYHCYVISRCFSRSLVLQLQRPAGLFWRETACPRRPRLVVCDTLVLIRACE